MTSPWTDEPEYSTALSFDCDFESGNLLKAFKISHGLYHLQMWSDPNTLGNT